MLLEPRVDELLKKAENRYELAIIVSKRARQIVGGSEPMVDTKEKSPTTIASLELESGKLYSKKEEEKA